MFVIIRCMYLQCSAHGDDKESVKIVWCKDIRIVCVEGRDRERERVEIKGRLKN